MNHGNADMNRDPRATSTIVFAVRSFDIDAYGYLSPARIAGYFQQAASESADALGFGLTDLNRHGLTWVVVRQQWELDEALLLGDELCVETWPSGIERRAALRDFRLLKEGREVGRAVTSWLVLDMTSRRPVPPSTVLREPFHHRGPHVVPPAVEPISGLSDHSEQRRFEVRYSDIDVNHHVTNASYVGWAIDAIGASTWSDCRLAKFDVQFMAECGLGASVWSRATLQGVDCWRHSIVREDDQKELARAVSTWKRKE
jgi:medium-chain acyl-[acyl-carrier-protein] hydrolase